MRQTQTGRSWIMAAVASMALLAQGCGDAKTSDAPACDQGDVCRDSDCDRICDADEGYPERDTDGDGTPDYLDEDSDGDGLSDALEAGDDDLATVPADADGDGVPDFLQGMKVDAPGDLDAGAPDAATPPTDGGPLVVSDAGDEEPDAGDPTDSDGGQVQGGVCLQPIDDGCVAEELDSCDGLDNDCDGEVDEGAFCPCDARGAVRACFRGSPGQRGVGACRDGVQVCAGGEFSAWGPCTDDRLPSPEQCDDVDNDCNGCVDDLSACVPVLSCPEPGDPRVPVAKPFAAYTLDALDFYSGSDALGFQWRVAGSPCDTLFQSVDPSASAASGKLSYTLTGQQSQVATLDFSLSGNYPVELVITTPDGPQTCNFEVPVQAPGLRVELCWDQTGPTAANVQQRVDLDLHLAKQGTTPAWGATSDCYWGTCKGHTSPFGYASSSLDHCQGSQNTAVYENPLVNACPNPRLDADNRLDAASASAYITENINLDAPRKGDRYRVMVEYNTNTPSDRGSETALPTHPLVNIYCGGKRLGTFGGSPALSGADDPEELQGFERPGQRWHVADVAVTAGGENTLCDLEALTDNGGYWMPEDGGAPE